MKKSFLVISMLLASMAFVFAQQDLDDTDIADAIENEYRFDHAVNVNKIDVQVIDGIVELTGTVDNVKAKERAAKIAQIVKGVRSVSNRIDVKPPVVLSDEGIKDMVTQALFKDPATDSYKVTVKVDNKVVTLEGEVESFKEKELCGDVAKSVRGVVDLKNEITVDYQTDRLDPEIQNEVEAALKWNAQVDDGLIDVKVNNGNVELSGVVGSAAEKSNAYYTAWVAGVKSVDNSGLEVRWWAEDEELRKNKYLSMTDEEIEQAIKDAALYDPRVYSFDIQPEVNNGWVTLRGTVDNLKAKRAAEKLAEHTTGVHGVTNRIKVQWEELLPTDAEIESEIVRDLADNAITESWEIDVNVDNGIATLTGVVDSYLEKKEAEWVAGGVQGVSDVNNILQVNYPYGYYWWGNYPYYNLHITPPDNTDVATVELPDDDRIKRNVEREIWWSPYVDSDQVEVTVENGDVTLEGTVDSWKEYQKAAENAWEGGAWAVTNRLLVVNE